MLAREDLCSPGKIYARPGRFMLAREDLRAVLRIYERFSGFMSDSRDLRSVPKNYERIINFTVFNEINELPRSYKSDSLKESHANY
jgi:hypothetical protein